MGFLPLKCDALKNVGTFHKEEEVRSTRRGRHNTAAHPQEGRKKSAAAAGILSIPSSLSVCAGRAATPRLMDVI